MATSPIGLMTESRLREGDTRLDLGDENRDTTFARNVCVNHFNGASAGHAGERR